MLLNGGVLDGRRLLGRKTVEFMRTNRLADLPESHTSGNLAQGFGLGVSVTIAPGESSALASRGRFGWSGAATTDCGIDPDEQIVALVFAQHFPFDEHRLFDGSRTATCKRWSTRRRSCEERPQLPLVSLNQTVGDRAAKCYACHAVSGHVLLVLAALLLEPARAAPARAAASRTPRDGHLDAGSVPCGTGGPSRGGASRRDRLRGGRGQPSREGRRAARRARRARRRARPCERRGAGPPARVGSTRDPARAPRRRRGEDRERPAGRAAILSAPCVRRRRRRRLLGHRAGVWLAGRSAPRRDRPRAERGHACSLGSQRACNQAGVRLASSASERARGIRLLEQSCGSGEGDACRVLGEAYTRGSGSWGSIAGARSPFCSRP